LSATSIGSPPQRRPRPPQILVDRSLAPKFAAGLTNVGFAAVHLDDLMPTAEGESIPDVTWIEYVGKHRWIALAVNPDMRKVPLEMDAIRNHGARVFSLGSAQVNLEMRAFIIGRHWASIVRRAQRPGPCFWRLYADRDTIKTIR
jgi:hypothetical protein